MREGVVLERLDNAQKNTAIVSYRCLGRWVILFTPSRGGDETRMLLEAGKWQERVAMGADRAVASRSRACCNLAHPLVRSLIQDSTYLVLTCIFICCPRNHAPVRSTCSLRDALLRLPRVTPASGFELDSITESALDSLRSPSTSTTRISLAALAEHIIYMYLSSPTCAL